VLSALKFIRDYLNSGSIMDYGKDMVIK